MTEEELFRSVLEGQSPEGAFYSTIHYGDRRYTDWNGFTTAQMIRAFNRIPESEPLKNARNRALDFLMKCESSVHPGAFGFWPKGANPSWIQELPEDADDTSIITLELLRHGCIDLKRAREIAIKVILPYRVREIRQPSPPWIRRGVFLTWLRAGGFNVIDCCVNANVVSLLAYVRLNHLPGFNEACEMIEYAIQWAGSSKSRFQSILPFYPHPAEFIYAIQNAVECGADQLEDSLSLLKKPAWKPENGDDAFAADLPICGSAYGHIIWTSRVLQIARKLSKRKSKIS